VESETSNPDQHRSRNRKQKHANVHSAELSPRPANEDELETDLGPHLVTEDEQVIAAHGFMRDLGLRRQGEVAMSWEGVVRP
jgi:hypothetical protein